MKSKFFKSLTLLATVATIGLMSTLSSTSAMAGNAGNREDVITARLNRQQLAPRSSPSVEERLAISSQPLEIDETAGQIDPAILNATLDEAEKIGYDRGVTDRDGATGAAGGGSGSGGLDIAGALRRAVTPPKLNLTKALTRAVTPPKALTNGTMLTNATRGLTGAVQNAIKPPGALTRLVSGRGSMADVTSLSGSLARNATIGAGVGAALGINTNGLSRIAQNAAVLNAGVGTAQNVARLTANGGLGRAFGNATTGFSNQINDSFARVGSRYGLPTSGGGNVTLGSMQNAATIGAGVAGAVGARGASELLSNAGQNLAVGNAALGTAQNVARLTANGGLGAAATNATTGFVGGVEQSVSRVGNQYRAPTSPVAGANAPGPQVAQVANTRGSETGGPAAINLGPAGALVTKPTQPVTLSPALARPTSPTVGASSSSSSSRTQDPPET